MDFTNAPKTKDSILSPEELEDRLHELVGTYVELTRKSRTDGSNIRKMISSILSDRVSNALDDTEYEVLPPKGKGVPRLLLELLDSYVVTSGDVYNLQIWNRSPNSNSPLVRYKDGTTITSRDIRLVLIKMDMEHDLIESVVIMTPQYIEDKFGKFGKPTIKQQLIVSQKKRQEIVDSENHVHFNDDTIKVNRIAKSHPIDPNALSETPPSDKDLLPLKDIYEKVGKKLIGEILPANDTKSRGQLLERKVIELLGYSNLSKLVGGYPDVPNQFLEVKVQDSPTIDLGKYSPQFEELVDGNLNLTTRDVRYLIALTNPDSNKIEGLIISSGEHLGDIFTYVSDKSYKCQRSINMTFFDDYIGQCVFNPED